MDDVYVYFVPFPTHKIHEMVVPCTDGYTVYIDEDLDQATREAAYAHAMEHIRAQDWDRDDVQQIEAQAHAMLPSPAPVQQAVPEPVRKVDPKDVEEEQRRIRERFERAWNRLQKRRERIEARGVSWEDYVFAKRERELFDV